MDKYVINQNCQYKSRCLSVISSSGLKLQECNFARAKFDYCHIKVTAWMISSENDINTAEKKTVSIDYRSHLCPSEYEKINDHDLYKYENVLHIRWITRN